MAQSSQSEGSLPSALTAADSIALQPPGNMYPEPNLLASGAWDQRVQGLQNRLQGSTAYNSAASPDLPTIDWQSGQIHLTRLLSSNLPTTAQTASPVSSEPAIAPNHSPCELVSESRTSEALSVIANASSPSTSDSIAPVESNSLSKLASPAESSTSQSPSDERLLIQHAAHESTVPKPRSATVNARSRCLPDSAAHDPQASITGTPAVAPDPTTAPSISPPLPISDNNEDQPTRWRPASWMLSTVTHAVALVVLASMSLAVAPPKDQLAFSGSAGDSEEAVIENFQIETSEPSQPTEPTIDEATYDVSELGTVAVTEVNVDLPSSIVSPTHRCFRS